MIGADDFSPARDECQAGAGWRKFGMLLLGFAAIGPPINDISVYALLAILTSLSSRAKSARVAASRPLGFPHWSAGRLCHRDSVGTSAQWP
jgi:hypothetical protein